MPSYMNLLVGRDDYQLTSPVRESAGISSRSVPPSPMKRGISISNPSNPRSLISDVNIAAGRTSVNKAGHITRSQSEGVVPIKPSAMTEVYVDPISILRHSSVPCSRSFAEESSGSWFWVCCTTPARLYLNTLSVDC